MKKSYKINIFSCLNADHIMISDNYSKNLHGIELYIDDEMANKIRNIKIIKHFNKNHSMNLPKDYILHEIYKVLPELFEDET